MRSDQRPPNSPDLNPLVSGAVLQAFHKLYSKPKTIQSHNRHAHNLHMALRSSCGHNRLLSAMQLHVIERQMGRQFT